MENQNREVTREIQKIAGLSELTGYPRKVADAIIPVINVNPKRVVNVCESNTAASSNATIYTTPSDKDFYLCTLFLSSVDFEADSLNYDLISAVMKGKDTRTFLKNYVYSVTGKDPIAVTNSITLNPPALLERGTAITLTGNTLKCTGGITGYMETNPGD